MNKPEAILSKAKNAGSLDQRISENLAGQSIDLVEWIFERLTIPADARILEVCCGTGGQTIRFLDKITEAGHVVAVDMSGEALDTLKAKVEDGDHSKVTLVESDMDALPQALAQAGPQAAKFDLAFCAYGLYYSKTPVHVLETIFRRLNAGGSIFIVGPYGPNNGPLFELVEESGVTIPSFVRYTSQDFMCDQVIPWSTRVFETVSIHTVVNSIQWDSPERVLNYWRNSTFFDPDKLQAMKKNVADHFDTHECFRNEKWIMMVEMKNARR